MADPTDSYTIGAFRMVTGRDVKPQVAIPSELDAALERLYGAGRTAVGQIVGDVEQRDELAFDADIQHLKDLASEAPVIRLVSLIITNALEARASDIHIEPFENRLAVRYRIDGVLHEVESPPRRFSAAVISRVKIMANLDIAETPAAAGRTHPASRARQGHRSADLAPCPRCTANPWSCGYWTRGASRWILRVSASRTTSSSGSWLCSLQPHGILLVTGPTGSGKTTTLYTALERLNQPDVKILTVEDPVEYQMPGHQPDPGQAADQPDVRQCAALDRPAGSGCDHDRRDPRPRDRGDRRAVGADGPPRAVDGAYERRGEHHEPPA